MLKLFKTILKVGDTTVKYPFKPLEVSHGFRGKPQYDADQCIACGACTMACPANALTMETDLAKGTRQWQLFLGRCIFVAAVKKSARPAPLCCHKSLNWRYSIKPIYTSAPPLLSPIASSASSLLRRKRGGLRYGTVDSFRDEY